jgi:bla regulator protein BlaR1
MRWIVPLLIAIAPAQAAYAQAVHAAPADRLSYVLFTGKDGSSISSGWTNDFRHARSYHTGNGPLLYVRDNGIGYVIRDPAILRRAEAIMKPQQELGRRQGELGRQQGELGRRQGALGREQGRLGRMMADARVRELGELGRQQGELGRQQGALGAQQAALGRRQAALGREQARLAELAKPQFRALVAEAIRRGVAQRVD